MSMDFVKHPRVLELEAQLAHAEKHIVYQEVEYEALQTEHNALIKAYNALVDHNDQLEARLAEVQRSLDAAWWKPGDTAH